MPPVHGIRLRNVVEFRFNVWVGTLRWLRLVHAFAAHRLEAVVHSASGCANLWLRHRMRIRLVRLAGKPYLTLHEADIVHPLKEVDAELPVSSE